MSNVLHALILAGGSGERFWPVSRTHRPKQLLNIVSGKSMLSETVERLDGLVPRERIIVLTNCAQEAGVREACPDLPPENILAEPAKRDTAAAIGLGTAWIAARDSHATMVVLPADHLITNREAFQKNLLHAASAAEARCDLVTLGIEPTWACPGFGYIERGKPVCMEGTDGTAIYEVKRFREKPAADLAEQFLRQGNFFWNAGMFVWPVQAILNEFSRHVPDIAAFITRMHEVKKFNPEMQDWFCKLPKTSIDYAVMEKAHRVLVAKADFDWDDLGTWPAVAKYLDSDKHRNRSNSPVVQLHSADNIVFSRTGKTIALLGVNDLLVIESEDALLVCNANEAESIKSLVAKLPPDLQ